PVEYASERNRSLRQGPETFPRFMPGIAVMFLEPRVQPFVETVVLEMILQAAFRSLDHGHRVDQTFPPHFLRTKEPKNPGWIDSAMAQPLPHEEVLVAEAKGHAGLVGVAADGLQLIAQLSRNNFIGVRIINPGMFEADVFQRPV